MKTQFLLVGAAISATALLMVAPASARGDDKWWTSDHAESVLLDSDFAFDRDVQDATCAGWGAYKIGSDGTKTFTRFACSAYAEFAQPTCLPGECANGTVTTTCQYKVKFRTIGADTFLLASTRSNCA